jgi:RHS repeat-associated protein
MLGSSRALATSTGTLCYDADFYPYGGEHDYVNTCAQNYKFTGKERDPETNNDDFDARYYSSAYGRFLSADWSSTPTPVPYANLTNPQTLNLYAMVSDNPESFADLDGHKVELQSNTVACAAGGSESCEAQEAAAQNSGTAQSQTTQVQNATLNVGGTKVEVTLDKSPTGVTIEANPQGCGDCRWAQTVTRTGDPTEATHTDRQAQSGAQPLYPTTERLNGFYDSPSTHQGGSGTFTATTTLGVADKENKTFKAKGSITWGYSVDKAGNVSASKARVATQAEQTRSIAVLKRDSPSWTISP